MDPAHLHLLVLIGSVSAVRDAVPDQAGVDAPAIIASPEARLMVRTLPTLSLVPGGRQVIQSADSLPAPLTDQAGPVELPQPGGAVPQHLGELVAALQISTNQRPILCVFANKRSVFSYVDQ